MGRSKRGILDRGEQKRKKAGLQHCVSHEDQPRQVMYKRDDWRPLARVGPQKFKNARRAVDTRRSADSSITHAILFVVLVVIVISWALGY